MWLGLIIFVAALVAFEFLAARLGRDTRDGSDWVAHDGDLDRHLKESIR